MKSPDYRTFKISASARQWKRLGARKRAGVMTGLFSVYSKKSVGIGELPDLKLLVDWCKRTGFSLIQLLPMNDVGFNFRPYDSHSSFALEPMYLSLEDLAFVEHGSFSVEIRSLRRRFIPSGHWIDTGIKSAKLALLRKIFSNRQNSGQRHFERYCLENRFWLKSYALFKLIKGKMLEKNWEEWPEDLKRGEPEALLKLGREDPETLEFHQWVQWQLFMQFGSAAKYARENGVFLMGDLPFLVSRDSADVWAHPRYFKLEYGAGAPPDLYFAQGQRWGMPPYHWENIAVAGYDYLIEKLKYAGHFYDLFRVDHFVGVFRIWTYPLQGQDSPGVFDPPEESVWEEHGRKIVSVIVQNTGMLPCAEDLGTVPPCSYPVLKEFAIPGTEVQRWTRDWNGDRDFIPAKNYRENSVAVLSTHDMDTFVHWWESEAGVVAQQAFRRECQAHGIRFEEVEPKLFDLKKSGRGALVWKKQIKDSRVFSETLGRPESQIKGLIDMYKDSYREKERFCRWAGLKGACPGAATNRLVRSCLETLSSASSVFSIQLLQDWLSLGPVLKKDFLSLRINVPGAVNDRNWRLRLPLSLEKMKTLAVNKTIRSILQKTGRI